MTTFNRWNKIAGLLNESVETEQIAESTQDQAFTMNEAGLRGMIAEIAKDMLVEARRASRDEIEDIQRALIAVGALAPGEDDGAWGPKTATALATFQSFEELDVDGVVGPGTLKSLAIALDRDDADSALVSAMADMVDAGIIAGRKGFIGDFKAEDVVFDEPEAVEPEKQRKSLVKSEETSDEDLDAAIEDMLAQIGADISPANDRAAATALVKLGIGSAAHPGDEPEEDVDLTDSALLPGISGFGAAAWSRGVEVTDKRTGEKITTISKEDWEAAGAPTLPGDVEVFDEPDLGK